MKKDGACRFGGKIDGGDPQRKFWAEAEPWKCRYIKLLELKELQEKEIRDSG